MSKVDKNRSKLPKFSKGALVLIKNFCTGTFDPKYNNDFTVLQQPNPSTVLVKGPRGDEIKVNVHHLKSRQPPPCQKYNL